MTARVVTRAAASAALAVMALVGPSGGAQAQMDEAIKGALSQLGAARAVKPPDDPACHAFEGTWRWPGGQAVTVRADGTVLVAPRTGPASNGAWTCDQPGGRRFTITGGGLGKAALTLDADGRRLTGRDGAGRAFAANRDGPIARKPPHAGAADRGAPLGADCAVVAGHWLWSDGARLTLAPGGQVIGEARGGHWRCAEPAARRIGVTLEGAGEIVLTLTPDGQALRGRGADGWPVGGTRPR